jgi:LacI family transcriptional regulator
MPLKQKDIARYFGVSVSLVSRALNGKAEEIGVSPETIRRICDYAESHGYVASAAARTLKGAPSGIIGVVVFDFDDPYFGPVIGSLQHLAHERGLSLILAGFERRMAEPRDLQSLLRNNLDGLVVLGSGEIRPWIHPFIQRRMPVVRLGCGDEVDGVHTVCTDDDAGMCELLNHLQSLGHIRIGFIGGMSAAHRRRLDVYRRERVLRGLVHNDRWIALSEAPVNDAGIDACQRLLQQCGEDRPTAIMASGDLFAVGAIHLLAEKGMNLPGAMSLTGFDDIPIARQIRPSLTTVRQPVREMVETVFDHLLHSTFSSPPRIEFKPQLVVRGSTALVT